MSQYETDPTPFEDIRQHWRIILAQSQRIAEQVQQGGDATEQLRRLKELSTIMKQTREDHEAGFVSRALLAQMMSISDEQLLLLESGQATYQEYVAIAKPWCETLEVNLDWYLGQILFDAR